VAFFKADKDRPQIEEIGRRWRGLVNAWQNFNSSEQWMAGRVHARPELWIGLTLARTQERPARDQTDGRSQGGGGRGRGRGRRRWGRAGSRRYHVRNLSQRHELNAELFEPFPIVAIEHRRA
jgi:hypothetical protein